MKRKGERAKGGPTRFRVRSWVLAGICLFGATVTAAAVPPRSDPPPPQINTTMEELATVLSTLFPPIDVEISAVEAQRIEIAQGRDQGLRPGLLLTVYRAGKVFRHPLTGVPMGQSDELLGTALVESVDGARTTARIVSTAASGPPPIRAGDRMRLTAGRIPIALVTASTTSSGSTTMAARFRRALDETERFRVTSLSAGTDMPPLMTDQPAGARVTPPESVPSPPVSEALMAEAGKQGIDYLFFFDARLRGGSTVGAVAIVEAVTGRPVDAVQTTIRLGPGDPLEETADPLLQVLSVREGQAFREARFPYRAEHLVIGDLDHDGTDELVVSDGVRLRLYHLKELSPVVLFEEPLDRPDRRQWSVDIADINGTGRPQLFVTSTIGDRLDSYVVEWQGGVLKRVVEHQPFYFRIVTPPGKPAVLVGQERSMRRPFDGAVTRLKWTGQGFTKGEPIPLPSTATLYDFTLADMDRDGRDDLLYLDEKNYLVLVNADGRLMGKSAESFGGVESFIEYTPANIGPTSGTPVRARIPAQPVVIDLDGDGVPEIIVAKNVPLTKYLERKAYRYGQIFALGWNGSQFVQKWVIPKVDGVITDVGLASVLGADAGAQILILAQPTLTDAVLTDLFSSRSQLLFYTMPRG